MKKNSKRVLFLIVGLSCVVTFTERVIAQTANHLLDLWGVDMDRLWKQQGK